MMELKKQKCASVLSIICVLALSSLGTVYLKATHDQVATDSYASQANYSDYDDDIDGRHESYNNICDQIPEVSLPRWRLWLHRFGALLFVGALRVKALWQRLVARSRAGKQS